MALQATVEIGETGINVEAAYIRVSHYTVIPKEQLRYTLSVYKDKESRDARKQPFAQIEHTVPAESLGSFDEAALIVGGSTVLKQLYVFLKAMPEFQNSTDV